MHVCLCVKYLRETHKKKPRNNDCLWGGKMGAVNVQEGQLSLILYPFGVFELLPY